MTERGIAAYDLSVDYAVKTAFFYSIKENILYAIFCVLIRCSIFNYRYSKFNPSNSSNDWLC